MINERPHYPPAIPYLIMNEMAERFSFYGMRSILVVFMTTALLSPAGTTDPMTETQAKAWYHAFLTAVYLAPIAGALLADMLIGKYLTILLLSLVYCAGHAALAVDQTRGGLALGLALIAIGSGGIKPCVSANIGDQIESPSPLASKVFAWFYMAINVGALLSMMTIPKAMQLYGPATAFALPGVLMLIATATFYAGRKKFIKKKPLPRKVIADMSSSSTRSTLAALLAMYALVAVFWSLYDQIGSSLLLQASRMTTTIAGLRLLPAQIQAINPILVITFIPFVTYVVYPAMRRKGLLTDAAKITTGMSLAAASFFLALIIQKALDNGATPNIVCQLPVYLLLTTAEVMISVTCLEISYKQAPETMRSIVMALFMLSIAAGNMITTVTNLMAPLLSNTEHRANSTYYLFFAMLMTTATLTFTLLSRKSLKNYLRQDTPETKTQ